MSKFFFIIENKAIESPSSERFLMCAGNKGNRPPFGVVRMPRPSFCNHQTSPDKHFSRTNREEALTIDHKKSVPPTTAGRFPRTSPAKRHYSLTIIARAVYSYQSHRIMRPVFQRIHLSVHFLVKLNPQDEKQRVSASCLCRIRQRQFRDRHAVPRQHRRSRAVRHKRFILKIYCRPCRRQFIMSRSSRRRNHIRRDIRRNNCLQRPCRAVYPTRKRNMQRRPQLTLRIKLKSQQQLRLPV